MAGSGEEKSELQVVATPVIENRILVVRGRQVILDEDLAGLYGVETRVLVQQVRRNAKRFPSDFMFQLSAEEFSDLKSQFVISSGEHGGRRQIFKALRQLIEPPPRSKRPVGFRVNDDVR